MLGRVLWQLEVDLKHVSLPAATAGKRIVCVRTSRFAIACTPAYSATEGGCMQALVTRWEPSRPLQRERSSFRRPASQPFGLENTCDMESALDVRGRCDLARADRGRVRGNWPARFAQVAKTPSELDHQGKCCAAASGTLLCSRKHCGRTAAIQEKPKRPLHRELGELRVMLPSPQCHTTRHKPISFLFW